MARVGKLYTIPGRESGRLDVFIFCAGYLPGERMALDLLLSDIHAFFEVKIKGDGALVSDWLTFFKYQIYEVYRQCIYH